MSTKLLIRTAALVLSLPTALGYAAPQASAPDLRLGTAPFVGKVLTLDVEGAVPNSPIQLWFSTQPGTFVTPYGVLELKRNAIQILASGTTSAAGTWSFDLPVPLDPALAETGAHFQALVDDPSAPAGKVFSDALHARFLGPRVYAGYGAGQRAGLRILSAVTESIVVRVDCAVAGSGYGFPREGKPVFDTAYSRGAAMITERDLLLFDPFFGAALGRIGFASTCARTVFTDAARQTVYVLELAGGPSPARIHAIDLASGAETSFLDLPNAVEPMWCLGRASSEAYVAEHEPGGRTAVRRVGLLPLVDRGSAPVGIPESDTFTSWNGTDVVPLPMVFASGQVFVSTLGAVGQNLEGSLTRCWPAPSGFTTHTTALGTTQLYKLDAVPAAQRLLGGTGATDTGPVFFPCEVPFSPIGPPVVLPDPNGFGEFYIRDIEPDGATAWVVAEWEWQHSDILYRVDLPSHTWTQYPHFWFFGPSDAEVVRDVWNHEVWISNLAFGPPINIAPEILVVDELHGTVRHIPLDRTAGVLHAVPLP